MKEVLIFANETPLAKEIVQHLIQKHFKITIFASQKFKDNSVFVGATPLQVSVVAMKISNHYNWKHELPKYDVVINLLKITDFSKENREDLFGNFLSNFAEFTKNIGKVIIHLSNVCNEFQYTEQVQKIENQMLYKNPGIVSIKYGFLIFSQSQLLTDIINTKFLLISKKILNANIQITMVCDISNSISQIINQTNIAHNITINGENYSFQDIITMVVSYTKQKKIIVKVPHFIFMMIAKFYAILPQRFYYTFLNYKILKCILHLKANKFKGTNSHSYTLFGKVLNKHFTNLFTPEIE